MTKEDLGKALSLSCVENYFLAYFKDKFDIRKLYVESFLPFNKIINDFCDKKQKYENYGLIRVQDISEKLELTTHTLEDKFNFDKNALNLIRVNKMFFQGAKLFPWREDHYISIEQKGDDYIYYNNYPLTQKDITIDGINQIFDFRILRYAYINRFNADVYEKLATAQYNAIIYQKINNFELKEENILSFRSAILVLKTIRQRLVEWFYYENKNGSFLLDDNFIDFSKEYVKAYNDIFIKLELMIARKKMNISLLQEKLDSIIKNELKLSEYVRLRRLGN